MFYRAPDNLLEQVLARHTERMAHPHAVLNRIVYDSMEVNPMHKVPRSLPLFFSFHSHILWSSAPFVCISSSSCFLTLLLQRRWVCRRCHPANCIRIMF
jgi:hypothetical protein